MSDRYIVFVEVHSHNFRHFLHQQRWAVIRVPLEYRLFPDSLVARTANGKEVRAKKSFALKTNLQ